MQHPFGTVTFNCAFKPKQTETERQGRREKVHWQQYIQLFPFLTGLWSHNEIWIMTPYCWDVVLLGWMIVWLGIRIGSNGWSPLKWLGSTWKQRLTEVLSWPNTAQPVFIKVSAPGLSANNTDWMGLFYILFIFPALWSFFPFNQVKCWASLNCRCASRSRGGISGPRASEMSPPYCTCQTQ